MKAFNFFESLHTSGAAPFNYAPLHQVSSQQQAGPAVLLTPRAAVPPDWAGEAVVLFYLQTCSRQGRVSTIFELLEGQGEGRLAEETAKA